MGISAIHIIKPLEFIENPNQYRVIEVFQSDGFYETLDEYIDNDFDKNFEHHLSENGIKEGNDEINEMLDFRDELNPYCYFFIGLPETDLKFMEKVIFTAELIDLFDIEESEKEELYINEETNSTMVVKLMKRLRNLQSHPIQNITRLKEISEKIDFDNMYDIYLEL